MSGYVPQVGDRVRIVFEETVTHVYPTGRIGAGRLYLRTDEAVSVEKVEPPVVTFKSGDTVRSKKYGVIRTLGHKGYLRHDKGEFYSYVTGHPAAFFKSDRFELVDLGGDQ